MWVLSPGLMMLSGNSGRESWGVLPLPSLDLGVAALLSLVQFPGVWLG